jgi:hypothetical protein
MCNKRAGKEYLKTSPAPLARAHFFEKGTLQ